MKTTSEIGRLGEDFAACQLADAGYQVLARGFRSGRSEIDIIAQKDAVIAFIEVKTRSEDTYGSPAESVKKSQRRRIVLAAVDYMREKGIYGTGELQPRFDVFEVLLSRDRKKVIRYGHIPSAYGTEGLDVFI